MSDGNPFQIQSVFGLGSMLGGGLSISQASQPSMAQYFIDRQTTIGDAMQQHLIKTAGLLAKANGRLGGPKMEEPEYRKEPPVQPFRPDQWMRHVMQLAEEVAWRAGEPLPRAKDPA